jgi:DNA-binding response OmpR family regulator
MSGAMRGRSTIDGQADSALLVLVADDDPMIRELVSRILEEAGYRVVTAEDGAEAIELIRVSRPAAAILDVMMPGLDGIETMRRLRDAPETAELPILLVTAHATSTELRTGRELGADYLRKPFTADDLRARVAGLVTTR